jgi:tetratricopeptide (TPR) repeat protein
MRSWRRPEIVLGLLLGLTPAASAPQSSAPPGERRQTAIQLEQQGALADAETAWKSLLRSDPTNAEADAHIGLLEARQEHYKQAVLYYRKALELNASIPGLRLDLGLSQFKGGEFKGAIQSFGFLLRTEPPSSPEALRLTTLIGLAQFGLGEYAAAVPYLKKATAADPQNLPFRMTLAQSCLWSKQYQCVLDVYKEIVTLNADSAEADMLAGQAYDEMKNDVAALEQFRAAVKTDPRLPNVHFGYGYLLWRQLKFDAAEQEFKAELDNNPEHTQALTFLGDTEIHQGHPEAALPFLKHALRINPSLALAHLDLGIVYSDQRQNNEALRELQTAARLSPQDPNVHWRLGRLYQSMGRKAEAKAEFDKTRILHKAADQSVFAKIREAHDKGTAVGEKPNPSTVKSAVGP